MPPTRQPQKKRELANAIIFICTNTSKGKTKNKIAQLKQKQGSERATLRAYARGVQKKQKGACMYNYVQTIEDLLFEKETLTDLTEAIFQKFQSKEDFGKFHSCISVIHELEKILDIKAKDIIQK